MCRAFGNCCPCCKSCCDCLADPCGYCVKCCNKQEGVSHIKPNSERGCTDFFIFLLFILCNFATFFLVYEASMNGAEPTKMYRGVDMWGRVCGVHPDVVKQPFGANPYFGVGLSKENAKIAGTAQICVSDCKQTESPNSRNFSSLYYSKAVMYFCVPQPWSKDAKVQLQFSGDFNGPLQKTAQQIGNAVADLSTSISVLIACIFLGFVATFYFVFFLRCCAKTMVYSMILLIFCCGLMLAFTILQLSQKLKYESQQSALELQLPKEAQVSAEQRAEIAEICAYVVAGITGIFLLVVFFCRQQINIAIEVVKEGSRAFLDMKAIVIYPIIPLVFIVSYCMAFIYMIFTILSVMDSSFQETPDILKKYDFTWMNYIVQTDILPGQANPNIPDKLYTMVPPVGEALNIMRVKIFYLLFNFFWVSEFIHYSSFMTFALACAHWYFAARDENGDKKRGSGKEELSNFPLINASWTTIRYHTGTIAVCSLIIAIIKTIRAIVLYIESQVGERNNHLQRVIFCLIHCCLKCIECCCDKVNKNALIWTAVFGSNFCISACSSFLLIFKNMVRTAALSGVSRIIYFMGEISVAMTCATGTVLYLKYAEPYKTMISSPILPTICAFIIGYIIAKLFFSIFDSIVDTIFLCFLIDEQMNLKANPPREMRASKGLQKIINAHAVESKEKAEKITKSKGNRPGDPFGTVKKESS